MATLHLLEIEDDQVFQELVRRELHSQYCLECASTLAEARTQLSLHNFDCVLLDLRLPDGDGLTLLPELVSAGVPVVLMTAQGSEETAVQAMKCGAEDYLVKDITVSSKLAFAVASAIQRARLREAARAHEAEKDRLIKELHNALENVKTLQGLLPICCKCKKIRDDEGFWQAVEAYLSKMMDVRFTHGYCPECYRTACEELD